MRTTRGITVTTLVLVAFVFTGCRSMYYDTMEAFGRDKRDMLANDVQEMLKDQRDARAEFGEGVDKLESMIGGDHDMGTYDDLADAYDDAENNMDDVRGKLESAKKVWADLAREWQREIDEISDPALREESRQTLDRTQEAYRDMSHAISRTDERVGDVLVEMNDKVLFIKHHLPDLAPYERELEDLVRQLRRARHDLDISIEETERFQRMLPPD